MVQLSGFADEVSPDLQVQLDTFQGLRIRNVELRGVWGKNVLALSDEELDTVRGELERRRMAVSAVGSPIGKIRIDEPFEPHLAEFKRAIDIAERLKCPYIRVFSFFVPEGEAATFRTEVLDRMRALLEAASGRAVTLLHENERHIYGDVPERCRDLMETLHSPQLRMTFDPANFVMCGVRPYSEAYPMLADYVDYVHIKDGIMAEQRVVPAGQGDGEVRQVLSALHERGYDGFLSLEPHLAEVGTFSGFTGPELFSVATGSLRGLLRELHITER